VLFAALSPLLFSKSHTPSHVAWVLCYVVGVCTMMATSAAFHRIQWQPGPRRIMRRLDHSAIFLTIAGSYLAIAGLTMHGTIQLVLMLVISAGALIGIAIRQLALDAPKWVNTLPYLVVGWAAVAVLPQIYRGGGLACVTFILVGGVAYSVGAAFYAMKKPVLNPRVFGYHELFHACTIIGAGSHFVAISLALH